MPIRNSAHADGFGAVSANAKSALALPPKRIEDIELRGWTRDCFPGYVRSGNERGACRCVLVLLICMLHARGQELPSSFARPWNPQHQSEFAQNAQTVRAQAYAIDANHAYTLAELIDLAESHNPETRAAWENAKARVETFGIARSALYPTISALVLARTSRQNTLYATGFYQDTVNLLQPAINLNYLIFDFGGRSGAISAAKADLFAADFFFNDIHRQIIYATSASYYRLLNAMGQQSAAEATLLNARTIEKNTQARLDRGLATLPDLLEAQAASAQADFDLQAALGAVETAHGDLATTLTGSTPPASCKTY